MFQDSNVLLLLQWVHGLKPDAKLKVQHSRIFVSLLIRVEYGFIRNRTGPKARSPGFIAGPETHGRLEIQGFRILLFGWMKFIKGFTRT